MSERTDVIVLLGSSWSRMEQQNSRWRAVLSHWAGDERIGALRVVDYPSFAMRNFVRAQTAPIATWDERIPAIAGRVRTLRRSGVFDAFAWRAAGAAIDRALPPTGGRRVVIAATPIWARVLRHLRADRRGFDAVDDWRALPAADPVMRHVTAGYRAAASSDAVTTVSPALAERLRNDFGIDGTPVRNGVDVDAYVAPAASPRPDNVPAGPFAVYLGVVQDRVDLALLDAAASVLPVVVAGPAAAGFADALVQHKLHWLGPVEPARVPALLRAAAVGLVPHRVDALTTSMDPMKVLEYLAAGLPVVSTPVPLGPHSERILIADGVDAFADAVRDAMHLTPLGRPDPAVQDRSWRSVADALYEAHVGE
jgi:teichuronic acid biosynthesis glycosyltransferase TuaH